MSTTIVMNQLMMTNSLLSSLLLLALSSSAYCAPNELHYLEATGSAKLLADTDSVTWRISIRAEADALAQTADLLAESESQLRTKFEALGLPGNTHLKLSSIRSGRHFEKEDKKTIFRGFYAERQAKIMAPDLEKRTEIEHALLEDDRIEIHGLDITTGNHEDLKKEALRLALQAAKEKATMMVEELGADLGVLLSVQEGGSPSFRTAMTSNRIEMPEFANSQASEFEKIAYSSQVTARFAILSSSDSSNVPHSK
ncbi:MAG: SIMPL domain-containing protein [Verrucomicrobiota bacterium]